VSRLQTGQFALRLTDLDVGPFVQEVVERWREQLGGRHPLRVEVADGTPRVRADPARLDQVLANLLGNAAKYSPEGGPIEVAVQPDGAGVRVDVRDYGIGLPANAEQVIFRPFGRTSAAVRRQIPGLGLGLYICRQIMERHGGRIWAEPAHEAVGAVFSLWLSATSPGETAG
jgi:signal transduction histidine kinase